MESPGAWPQQGATQQSDVEVTEGGVVRVRRRVAGQRVEQAVAHAAAAVAEDEAGRYEAALEEYLAAAELLLHASLEDNLSGHMLGVVRAKEAEYVARAQLLSDGLKKAKAAAAARERATTEPVQLNKSRGAQGKEGLFARLRSNTSSSDDVGLSDAARFAALFSLPETSIGKNANQLHACVLSISTKEGTALVTEQKAHMLLLGRYLYIATETGSEGHVEKLLVTEITSVDKKRQGLMSARIQFSTLHDRTYGLGSVKADLFEALTTQLATLCEQTKVFGVPLDELLVREGRLTLGIPKIVEETVRHISSHGLTQEGIFRISCDHMQLMRLVTKVDRGVDIDWQQEEIHACTALLKKYLRDLPQPLFSPDLYSCFMAIHTLLEGDTEQAAMAKIESLVRYVFDFLDLVASQSSANKMHLQNLAFLREAEACNKLVLLMITQKERFFPADLLTAAQLHSAAGGGSGAQVPKYSSASLATSASHHRGA
ncbi:RhoGAP domain containing protein [Acanthamoeba castellanii str. Neff]|uniref:RhoGAP domain containing protein n=1 Tax=Acanthamoeba castellanii (strain ATCC 30010 / Neff) TaxID=1257118 RepID=L8H5D2_ACACF|nr:RhoGAP domain containing protein [Acanthamoeba castellanii str. Neff]ELR19646.1 RhoGAP domain containing protein [Acanthamoeba castellanii str. Neff]